MITELKSALIYDGTGWLPYLGDIVMEDSMVQHIGYGRDTLYMEEPGYDRKIDCDGLAIIPGTDAPMTMAKYEREVQYIKGSGKTVQKAVRDLTGQGPGQREFLKDGVPADVAVVDLHTWKIVRAYADGRELS